MDTTHPYGDGGGPMDLDQLLASGESVRTSDLKRCIEHYLGRSLDAKDYGEMLRNLGFEANVSMVSTEHLKSTLGAGLAASSPRQSAQQQPGQVDAAEDIDEGRSLARSTSSKVLLEMRAVRAARRNTPPSSPVRKFMTTESIEHLELERLESRYSSQVW